MNQHERSRIERGILCFTVVFGIGAMVNGVLFGSRLSGDALIHLRLMESTADGRWFEFNPGVPDASSSSILWTLLGAATWRLAGVWGAVYGLKAVAFLAWLGMGLGAYALARRLGASASLGWAGAAVAIGLPGTTMNSLQGMENGVFALLVVGAVLLVGRVHHQQRIRVVPALGAFPLIGLACATRPEGVVVWFAVCVPMLFAKAAAHSRLLLGTCMALSLIMLAPMVYVYHHATGHWIPSSGLSRVMAARRDSLSFAVLGPVWIYPRALVRLLGYAPLLALGAYGLSRRDDGRGALRGVVASSLALGYLAHTLLLGAAQTSRYMIWSYALFASAAAAGATKLWARSPRAGMLLGIAGGWLVTALVAESLARRTWLSTGYSPSHVVSGVTNRAAATDALRPALCAGGCCDRGTPRLAVVEVQFRFFLDHRFDVVSMDGVTLGPMLQPMRYDSKGCPMIDGVLTDGSIVAVLQPPTGSLQSCIRSGKLRSMAEAWGRAGVRIEEWQFDPALSGFVRQCNGPATHE